MQRIDHTCSSALNFINSNSRLSINLKIKWSLLKKITIYTIWRLIFRTKNPRIYEIINLGNSINWINRQERKKKKTSFEGCACKLCVPFENSNVSRPAWWSSRKFDGMINQCPREIWRQDLLKSKVGDPSATNRSLVTVITAFLQQYIHTASLPINLSSRLSSPRVLSSTGRHTLCPLTSGRIRSLCSYIVRKLISLLVIIILR